MAIPKYQHIKDELKQQIISGKFENGDKFYTEAELIKIYDVSSITVVRALSVSKEKEPLFLVLENTNWLNFQMLKPSQSKRPKSKFSLLNVEIP